MAAVEELLLRLKDAGVLPHEPADDTHPRPRPTPCATLGELGILFPKEE